MKSHTNGTLRGSEDDWSLWRWNGHLQKPVVFTLAADLIAAFGAALDEFDTHFILLELHKESASNMGRINKGTMVVMLIMYT